ncbi:MAG: energy transducer TonB [Luteimonas sp.]
MSRWKATFTAPSAPGLLRVACGVLFVLTVAACKQEQAGDTTAPVDPAAPTRAAPPASAISAQVVALSPEQLREKARTAYAESKLYAPAGDNAMEYYLALGDKQPGDAGVSSALIDLMPMAVIATEQSRDRGDFVEARRLYGLIEKADRQHPSLERLQRSIATAQEAEAKRAVEQQLTTEQEAVRQQQLQQERERQQQLQQQQAAQQLTAQQQAEQQAAAQRAVEQRAAEQRAAEQRAGEQRAAQAAAATPATTAPVAAATPSRPAANTELTALSTPSPRYPPEALRARQAGEVQVEFTVNPDGSVSNVRVVRASPPRVFDREATSAVRRWRFEPVAAPVTTRRTIGFTPGN